MCAKQLGKTLNSRELNALIHPLRYLDNRRNFAFLAADYLTLAAVMGVAVAFFEMRGQWGLAWAWNVPVYSVALLLIGAVQHRFAGLGHEGATGSCSRTAFGTNSYPTGFACSRSFPPRPSTV